MSWVIFTIIAVVLWSSVNVLDKFVLSRLVKRPVVPLLVLALWSLLVGVGVLLFKPVHLAVDVIAWSLFSGVLYAAGVLFYFYAAKRDEISRVVPLLYLSPLFVAFFANFFLGELLSFWQYVGVFLLVLGAVIIAFKGFRLNLASLLAMLSALIIAFYEIIMKFVLGFTDFWSVFALIRVGTFIGVLPLFFLFYKDLFAAVKRRVPFFLISCSVFGNILGLFFITLAFAGGLATLVASLSAVQPFIVFMLTLVLSFFLPGFLREDITRRSIVLKLLAIVLIFFGVILIT